MSKIIDENKVPIERDAFFNSEAQKDESMSALRRAYRKSAIAEYRTDMELFANLDKLLRMRAVYAALDSTEEVFSAIEMVDKDIKRLLNL